MTLCAGIAGLGRWVQAKTAHLLQALVVSRVSSGPNQVRGVDRGAVFVGLFADRRP